MIDPEHIFIKEYAVYTLSNNSGNATDQLYQAARQRNGNTSDGAWAGVGWINSALGRGNVTLEVNDGSSSMITFTTGTQHALRYTGSRHTTLTFKTNGGGIFLGEDATITDLSTSGSLSLVFDTGSGSISALKNFRARVKGNITMNIGNFTVINPGNMGTIFFNSTNGSININASGTFNFPGKMYARNGINIVAGKITSTWTTGGSRDFFHACSTMGDVNLTSTTGEISLSGAVIGSSNGSITISSATSTEFWWSANANITAKHSVNVNSKGNGFKLRGCMSAENGVYINTLNTNNNFLLVGYKIHLYLLFDY